jgi:phosphinothricin acetyltransferase
MTAADAAAVLAIYQAGIDEGHATFETLAPSWTDFDRTRRPDHRFVALDDPAPGSSSGSGSVRGWVAVQSVSARPAYAGVVEHSVYVDPTARGRGLGRALLGAVISSTEAAGIWTLQSGIFPENLPSMALHEAMGFRQIGRRERIARHHGRWRDFVLVERRSPMVR